MQVSLAAATIAAAAVILAWSCRVATVPVAPAPPLVVHHDAERVTFAAIGDYGDASPSEAAVAQLVHGWDPAFVITLGDNNYPRGAAATIDVNIGQFYARYIAPYRGEFGEGATANRFFPSLGNHDWMTPHAAPYLAYFELPGNERYYDVRWGPVHVFALDSDRHEPDGVTATGVQARWLEGALATSDAPWKLVYMHHPPYSSGEHGGTRVMRWPFGSWGADAVLSGHDHVYERLERDGVVYFTNGLSGSPSHYQIARVDPASRERITDVWGAMRIEADADAIRFSFVDTAGRELDTRTLRRDDPPPGQPG